MREDKERMKDDGKVKERCISKMEMIHVMLNYSKV